MVVRGHSQIHLALRVPNIPGQDTSKMNKMTWQMKIMRKAFHMVCDRNRSRSFRT